MKGMQPNSPVPCFLEPRVRRLFCSAQPALPPPPLHAARPSCCAAVCLSPEGRDIKEAHVKLPNELLGAYPAPAGDDAFFLNEIAVGTDGQ